MHQKDRTLEEKDLCEEEQEILGHIDFYEDKCDENPSVGNLIRLSSFRMMYYDLRFRETKDPSYKILYDSENTKGEFLRRIKRGL